MENNGKNQEKQSLFETVWQTMEKSLKKNAILLWKSKYNFNFMGVIYGI